MPNTGPSEPAVPVSGRERGWYRGDCHVHSTLSNGELAPEQLVADARAAGLDFLVTTEHNAHAAGAHEIFGGLDGAGLLVMLGQEVVTRTGHWLALGLDAGKVVDWDYGVGATVVERHLAEVHRMGGLCVAAHPHAPYPGGAFMYPFRGFDVVEVWNGQWNSDLWWQADNEAALAEWGRGLAADIRRHGRWRPAVGNSDTHLHGQIGTPHNVVAAEELGAGAILAAIRAGRTWIAESAAVQLTLTVSAGDRSAGIGQRLQTGAGPAVIEIEVSGAPSGAVTFHTERGTAHRVHLPPTGSGTVRWQTSAEESGFVRVEVRHPGGRMAALSNPVLLA